MAIILRLQNLPWSANSLDIRRYFQGLSIPEGGVHIVGGDKGDAFIAFTTDEDARQAMERDAGKVKDCKIKLMLSSRLEMQKVIEQARSQGAPVQTPAPPPTPKPKENERSRSPERSRRSSPDRRRDRERSPRGERDRDKNRKSSRKDKSRSRSPARRTRDRNERENKDRDSDRRSKRSDDKRKSDDVPKSRHDSTTTDNRSSVSQPQALPTGNGETARLLGLGLSSTRSSVTETSFGGGIAPFNQAKQQPQQNIEPWMDKTVWDDRIRVQGNLGGTNPENFRLSNVQQDFLGRDTFGRNGDSLNSLNNFSRSEEGDRTRFGLPPAFEGLGSQRRQEQFDNIGAFPKNPTDDVMGKPFRSFDSDQRVPPNILSMAAAKPRQGFDEPVYPPNPSRGLGFCIEVRGLPYSVSYKDIRDLFRGIFITNDGLKLINDESGQRTGTAVIRLTNQRDVNEALKRNRQYIGDSYIDVFRCTDNIFEQAVDSYLPGMQKSVHMPPRPDDLVIVLKGLPFAVKEDDIINFFDGLRILDLLVEHDQNGRSTGCGFVEFGTPEDLHAALLMNRRTMGHRYVEMAVSSKDIMKASRNPKAALDNQVGLPSIERDRLPVSKDLLPMPKSESRPSFCVALQGLPFTITDRNIADFFTDVGVPLAIHIMLNQDRLPTGEAFVEFTTIQQFELALIKSGQFIGPNSVKVLSIPYDEMMDILGNPVGRNDPLLNRPLNDSRGKGMMDDIDIPPRPMMNDSRHRLGIREPEEPLSSSRLGLGDTRGFLGGGGSMRDAVTPRAFPAGDSLDSLPLRGFPDGLGFRGIQEHRDRLSPHRGFPGDSRPFSARSMMDGLDRPRGILEDSQRNPRLGGRLLESEGFDDLGRNRRLNLQDDVLGKGRMTDTPDSRPRGPMDRLSDLKVGGRHMMDSPQNRLPEDMHEPRGHSDFGPGHEGRMHRGPSIPGGSGPHERRRMMPPIGGTSIGPGPDGFGKPGCVVGASNLPFRATAEEILAIFKDYSLTKENMLRRFDNLGRVTGEARLAFHKPEDAKKAVAELNGKTLAGRNIALFMA